MIAGLFVGVSVSHRFVAPDAAAPDAAATPKVEICVDSQPPCLIKQSAKKQKAAAAAFCFVVSGVNQRF
jgi:hypothetical protein